MPGKYIQYISFMEVIPHPSTTGTTIRQKNLPSVLPTKKRI